MSRMIFTIFICMFGFNIHAQAASFNCKSAKTSTEKQVCKTLSLNDADVKMSTTYNIIRHLVPMGTRGAIQDEQAAWLKQRNLCGAKITCLSQRYQERQQKLDQHMQRIYALGPF
ncbi:lysozyme inhibitor LprI family protein [Acinetobacter shaoyimingii]|uniref:DUF1311 domain-containing protein n=1 Tax=Acinetobacter shaoyimingii TaxID=2715164 RepID=A0A6G8S020_9GAMM|nr:lysozyme inhibitor LprI family protein [Acinetobacter shaoyimingii]QIO07552.1 DUF1311 domain-containing protein [Acinetobacter shaoyimingii]